MSEEDGWEFVNLGDQQSFGIKTAGLEEKATACQMLVGGPMTVNKAAGGELSVKQACAGADAGVCFCANPGVLCQRAEGGFYGVHGGRGEADGPSSQVLLP